MPAELSRIAITVGICVLMAACSPRLYQRETLQLDHDDLESFEIRYAEFDGCLLRRSVPVNYLVKRANYVMKIDVRFGADDMPASLDLGLSSAGKLDARFAGLSADPTKVEVETGLRYRIAASSVSQREFTVRIFRDGQAAGEETLRVKGQHCRAISLGNKTPEKAPASSTRTPQ